MSALKTMMIEENVVENIAEYMWFVIGVALNGFMLLIFGLYVSINRMKYQVSLGDGGNKRLNNAIRTHANGVEHVPMFFLQVLALEFLATTDTTLAILVTVFTLSRVVHAVGMFGGPFICRRIGATITYLAHLVAVLILIKTLVMAL